jgi:hypothetical protein
MQTPQVQGGGQMERCYTELGMWGNSDYIWLAISWFCQIDTGALKNAKANQCTARIQ